MSAYAAFCCRHKPARLTVRPVCDSGLSFGELMKPSDFREVLANRISRLRRPWLRSLQSKIVVILLLLPIAVCPADAATPASQTHVYLLRGVLNIFSLGLDEIAAKLEQQGIKTTVTNYLLWSVLADDAAAEYKSGVTKTIILIGHSSGATSLPDMVERLDRLGAPVKLAIGLDSVFRTSLSGHVGRYINFYVGNGNGEPVTPTKGLHGELENIDVGKIGMAHLTIDKNEIMQRTVISAIDAVAFGRMRPPSVAQQKDARASKRPSKTADAYAAARR